MTVVVVAGGGAGGVHRAGDPVGDRGCGLRRRAAELVVGVAGGKPRRVAVGHFGLGGDEAKTVVAVFGNQARGVRRLRDVTGAVVRDPRDRAAGCRDAGGQSGRGGAAISSRGVGGGVCRGGVVTPVRLPDGS